MLQRAQYVVSHYSSEYSKLEQERECIITSENAFHVASQVVQAPAAFTTYGEGQRENGVFGTG